MSWRRIERVLNSLKINGVKILSRVILSYTGYIYNQYGTNNYNKKIVKILIIFNILTKLILLYNLCGILHVLLSKLYEKVEMKQFFYFSFPFPRHSVFFFTYWNVQKYFAAEKEKDNKSVVLSSSSHFLLLFSSDKVHFTLLSIRKIFFILLRVSFCFIIVLLFLKEVALIGHVTAPTRNMTDIREIFHKIRTYWLNNGC